MWLIAFTPQRKGKHTRKGFVFRKCEECWRGDIVFICLETCLQSVWAINYLTIWTPLLPEKYCCLHARKNTYLKIGGACHFKGEKLRDQVNNLLLDLKFKITACSIWKSNIYFLFESIWGWEKLTFVLMYCKKRVLRTDNNRLLRYFEMLSELYKVTPIICE